MESHDRLRYCGTNSGASGFSPSLSCPSLPGEVTTDPSNPPVDVEATPTLTSTELSHDDNLRR